MTGRGPAILLVTTALVLLVGCTLSPTTQAPAAASPAAAGPSLGARTKTTGCQSVGGLPDPACTPGAVDPRVTQATVVQTICTSGWATSVRPPESVTEPIKRDEMRAYGLAGQRLADYELDHLVPLELGGAPADLANLWPEPWNGPANAHEKDAVENFLHQRVCSGAMALADAQHAIATNWLAVYQQNGLRPA